MSPRLPAVPGQTLQTGPGADPGAAQAPCSALPPGCLCGETSARPPPDRSRSAAGPQRDRVGGRRRAAGSGGGLRRCRRSPNEPIASARPQSQSQKCLRPDRLRLTCIWKKKQVNVAGGLNRSIMRNGPCFKTSKRLMSMWMRG